MVQAFSFFLFVGIATLIFGYNAYQIWANPENFVENIAKRNREFTGKWLPWTNFSFQWMASKNYIWYLRIMFTLAVLMLGAVLLLGVLGVLGIIQ